MVLDFAPTALVLNKCRRRFFPASSAQRRASRRWRPNRIMSPRGASTAPHRFLRTQVDKLRERHCDHIKTIEVREREFEVVKNEMAEVVAPPQRVVEGDEEHASKARKVEEDQPLWPLPPYMAVPYPEQRGHTAYLTFCTLPYSWGYDERAPYLDGRPLPDLSEYPEGMYPTEGDDEEMAEAPVGPPIPPPP